MPATAHRDAEATRQRLIRAGLDLFSSAEFQSTTTPLIARQAGVAEGTIYRHFASKEQLLNEVYRGAQRWGLRQVKDLEGERGLRTPERLTRLAQTLAEAAERDQALLRMLFRPVGDRHLDERSREAHQEFMAGLQQLVAMGKSDGQVRSGPAELWAAVWLALVGFALLRITAKEWSADQPQVAQVFEAAWDAVANRPPVVEAAL